MVLTTGLFVAWVGTPAASRADDYFVSSSVGDDAWSGTLPEPDATGTNGPRRSLGAASKLLEAARPGDRVLLRAGDTWIGTQRLEVSTAQGTEDDPIVLGRYGEGPKPRLELSGRVDSVILRGGYESATSHLVVSDLLLTTTAPAGQRPGGVFVGEGHRPVPPHHITLENLEVIEMRMGIHLRANDLVVKSCTVRGNTAIEHEKGHSQGLLAKGDRIVVRGCTFERNGRPGSVFDWNTYLSAGRGYVFEENVSRDTIAGLKLRRASDTIVRGNTFQGLDFSAISLGGDENGGIENVVVERNLILDTGDAIVIKDQALGGDVGTHNILIRNNVIRDNRRVAQSSMGGGYPGYVTITADPVDGVSILNNLIWGVTEQRGLFIDNPKAKGLRIQNNILGRADSEGALIEITSSDSLSGLILDHNLYSVPGGLLAVVERAKFAGLDDLRQAHPALEAAGLQGDPQLAAPAQGLRLTENSTLAIDRGTDPGGLVEDDFDGHVRPADGDGDGAAKFDIGPYELLPMTDR